MQAYLFDRLVHDNEDNFSMMFKNSVGFSFKWVHTDRKPQYLFRRNNTFKWISMKRSMVTECTEKPLAEKEIYHGKLVSAFAKQKRKHPLKRMCDEWGTRPSPTNPSPTHRIQSAFVRR